MIYLRFTKYGYIQIYELRFCISVKIRTRIPKYMEQKNRNKDFAVRIKEVGMLKM